MENLKKAGELERFMQAGSDALTDNITERLATTAANGLEAVDKLNDPDIREGVIKLLDLVGKLNSTGAIDELGKVAEKTAKQRCEGGIFSTISMLGKPETQRSLQFLLNACACLQKCK
jgi:uncharacterized protein YjgD (DUF1641 family)|tara:strand:- start:313 stop:666 length:354 start_codon:yes stop_codon:yes gene_type:complete